MRIPYVSFAIQSASAALALLFTFGCTTEVGDEGDTISEETEALVTGHWSGDLQNGNSADPGESPWVDSSLVAPIPCEVYSSGDHWWHPGKLWQGNCRIAWGAGIYVSPTYRTLEVPTGTNYSWLQYPGYTPSNAVVSTAGELPVCKGWRFEWTLGKLWQGACWFEYGGKAGPQYSSVPFYVLVK